MITNEQYARLAIALPLLQQADTFLQREFREAAFFARIPTGREVFVQGDSVEAIAFMLSGVIRVYKVGETGREITLYRFGVGESCILTANAILSHHAFAAIATVEQDAEAIMVAADTFRTWVRRYDVWRDFVFDLLAQRLSSVMEIVDEVAFRRMDIRVMALVLERSQRQNPFAITHQEIAAELGSSREVISRILEHLAGQDLLRIGRGTLEVLDPQALEANVLR